MFRIEIELESPDELREFFADPSVQTPLLKLSAYHALRGALGKAIERNQTEEIRTYCPMLVSFADELPLDEGLDLSGAQTR